MVHDDTDVSSERRSGDSRKDRPSKRTTLKLAPEPIEIALTLLQSQVLVRSRPLDPNHVALLAEVPERWPPIVVERSTMKVLDGVHRVAAARRLGMVTIAARLIDGGGDEGFAEAVRSNVAHGLPLSLPERTSAARRLLASGAERSDRSIGEICGLDHKTVARFRQPLGCPSGEGPRSDVRIGRDKRARPLDAAGLRVRIAGALSVAPDDSLRQIAKRVGASPETVRDVRSRLARGEGPVPKGAARVSVDFEPVPAPASWPVWVGGSACRPVPDAAEFAAWFDQGAASLEWRHFIDAVPLSRVYEIADQARAYADAWRIFGEAVERGTRSGSTAL